LKSEEQKELKTRSSTNLESEVWGSSKVLAEKICLQLS
jgi:hypothetical protein